MTRVPAEHGPSAQVSAPKVERIPAALAFETLLRSALGGNRPLPTAEQPVGAAPAPLAEGSDTNAERDPKRRLAATVDADDEAAAPEQPTADNHRPALKRHPTAALDLKSLLGALDEERPTPNVKQAASREPAPAKTPAARANVEHSPMLPQIALPADEDVPSDPAQPEIEMVRRPGPGRHERAASDAVDPEPRVSRSKLHRAEGEMDRGRTTDQADNHPRHPRVEHMVTPQAEPAARPAAGEAPPQPAVAVNLPRHEAPAPRTRQGETMPRAGVPMATQPPTSAQRGTVTLQPNDRPDPGIGEDDPTGEQSPRLDLRRLPTLGETGAMSRLGAKPEVVRRETHFAPVMEPVIFKPAPAATAPTPAKDIVLPRPAPEAESPPVVQQLRQALETLNLNGSVASLDDPIMDRLLQTDAAPRMATAAPTPVRLVELQLHPAALGTLSVTMRLSSLGLKVSVVASVRETAERLADDKAELADLVRRIGYDGAEVTIEAATGTGSGGAGSGDRPGSSDGQEDRRRVLETFTIEPGSVGPGGAVSKTPVRTEIIV